MDENHCCQIAILFEPMLSLIMAVPFTIEEWVFCAFAFLNKKKHGDNIQITANGPTEVSIILFCSERESSLLSVL